MTIPPVGRRPDAVPDDPGDPVRLVPDAAKNEGKTLFGANVTLRVAEARVDDIGRAVARLAPADLVRIGARPGDVLQITGRMTAVARAELQTPDQTETIEIDGAVRSNAGAGLEELVSVRRVDHGTAVSVRLASVAGGSTPTAVSPELFIEKSAAGFESIGGLDEAKRLLRAIVAHAHVHDELYEQMGLAPPRGILFTGPSGTGKTAMARALSGEAGLPLIAVDGPQLFSKWLGESEKALRDVFKKARRAAPCLLFFDTIDALAPKLTDPAAEHAGAGVYPRILSQLVREVDGLGDVKGVILLAATNRPERIDPALLRSGRFDYVLRFEAPDAAAREAIARFCCRQAPLAPDVDLAELARRTDGRTGADIKSACKKAMLVAIDRYRGGDADTERFAVRWQDFLESIPS